MGSGPDRIWKDYNRAMERGDFRAAMSMARSFGLPLDLRDILSLTIAAGKAGDHIFDPMAVRWIVRAHEKGKTGLRLHEVEFLATTFRRLWGGDQASAEELWRFLATGKRL
ncbi:MAG: hypothetical protein JST08_01225 [Actinobacteria bacterium]|nr:hypothetical protein [Actinomycetota bacterium]